MDCTGRMIVTPLYDFFLGAYELGISGATLRGSIVFIEHSNYAYISSFHDTLAQAESVSLPKCESGIWEGICHSSRIISHLESESCVYMRFEKVQQQVSDVIPGRSLIASI
jgi:hypothetical protein